MKHLCSKFIFWLSWPLIWVYAPLTTRARVLVVVGDEFLAVKPYFGTNMWQLPGGGIRFGEQPKSAALRELREEVSITQEEATLLVPVKTYQERGLLLRYVLFLVELQQKPKVLPNKEIYRCEWLQMDSRKELSAHVQQALKAYNRVHLLK